MRITNTTVAKRTMWELDNGAVALGIAKGGGHLASLKLAVKPRINPYWSPVWKSLEPWAFKKSDSARYGIKLLAAILGHNPCLGAFGDPSAEEAKAGLGTHGEAPVARWKMLKKKVTAKNLFFSCGCDLPIAQMRFVREFRMAAGEPIVRVRNLITSLARRDMPFTFCEHATFGPPFVEAGVTLFDMPAKKGHTFPGTFGKPQRLRADAAFTWPMAPGVKGKPVDLRTLTKKSSDFSTQLIDPKRAEAWVSAVNPKLGLAVVYLWNRADYPWVGNWEEYMGRAAAPWNSASITRGMEFSNTPFPEGLRKAVDRGQFQGEKTFRWLPALSTVETAFTLCSAPVDESCKGVHEARTTNGGDIEIEWRS
ncbi:MAG: hypothetical protein R6X19_01205 [Kiritimatiellia bacterium]